jgi:hypothetical protein
MTARDRIRLAAMCWAYSRARQAGLSAIEAQAEAFEVADFIDGVMG